MKNTIPMPVGASMLVGSGPDMAPKSESSTQPSGSAATTVTDGDVPNGPKEISSPAGDAEVGVLVEVEVVDVELVEVLSGDPVHADPTIMRSAATRTRSDDEPFVAIPRSLPFRRRARLRAGSLDSEG